MVAAAAALGQDISTIETNWRHKKMNGARESTSPAPTATLCLWVRSEQTRAPVIPAHAVAEVQPAHVNTEPVDAGARVIAASKVTARSRPMAHAGSPLPHPLRATAPKPPHSGQGQQTRRIHDGPLNPLRCHEQLQLICMKVPAGAHLPYPLRDGQRDGIAAQRTRNARATHVRSLL